MLVGGRCIPYHKGLWNHVRVTKKEWRARHRTVALKKHITYSFVGIPAWVLLVDGKQGWAMERQGGEKTRIVPRWKGLFTVLVTMRNIANRVFETRTILLIDCECYVWCVVLGKDDKCSL